MRNHRSKDAFTLIELLTVIAIIALLAALIFPAIKGSLTKAEVSKAKTAAAGLETAFKSYYAEYGRWPITLDPTSLANSNFTYTVDTNFVALLQGADNTGTLTGGGGLPPFNSQVSTTKLQGNPRHIRFLEFKSADLDPTPTRGFVDPWKQPYYCRFDVSYGNSVDDPFTGTVVSPPKKVQEGFLVWSSGPDGQYDDKDTASGPSGINKDNVKSW
jgi:prepilin-type N-terminal cleavage/methylation domain-containing protein